MKRIFTSLLIAVLLVATLGICAFAAKEDWAKDNEFILASFHTLDNHVDKPSFEEAVYTLGENAEGYNIKYISFLGKLTKPSEHTYKSIVTDQKKSVDELVTLHQNDAKWNAQWQALKNMTELFTDMGIPYGLSYDVSDIYANGTARSRDSSQFVYFQPIEIFPEGVIYSAYDDANYYSIISNNDTKYIIFQLEIFPREAVLDWFNDTLAKHTDKYAIVYTPSFMQPSGELYTMWDWATGINIKGKTTRVGGVSLAHVGQPRDGEALWEYAFSKHDNILAVLSSSNLASPKINTRKLTNPNGYETVSVQANTSVIDKATGPFTVMTKISEDNKTLSFRFFAPETGYIEDSEVKVTLDKIATLTEPLTIDGLPTISRQPNGSNTAYILGYEGNTFRPNANMTRAEACTIFARLLLNTQTIPDGYVTRFEDVKAGDWFYNAVAYLDQCGFFFRNKNTTYKPNEPITRAEFVDLAYLASNLGEGTDTVSFTDGPKDHFYYNSIVAAASTSLVNGYEDNTFRPDNTITRAEVVTVINRLLNLAVSEDTVLPDRLANNFVDIGSHWAKLNVLMAANSNVSTKSSYSATLNGVSEAGNNLVFQNKRIKITVNKRNGQVDDIINLANGQSINGASKNPQFVYLSNPGGTKSVPKEMVIEGNRIKVTFKSGDVVYLIADIHDDYMAFELDSQVPVSYESITFANLSTNLEMLTDPESFRLGTMAMTANVFTVDKGMGYSNSTYATVYTKYAAGTIGSKHGFALSTLEENDDCLRLVANAIDRKKGLANTTGGPFTYLNKDTAGDYILITNATEENMKAVIEKAKQFNINQIDIHHNNTSSFRQGDFYFPTMPNGTAKEFGQTIGKLAKDNDILLGLHVYAYYIDYNATGITANPKWQKQLETMPDVYTLRGNLTKTKLNIKTNEDATSFDTTETFFYKNSRYILIDEEIIYVGQGTTEGFINVKRAQCGTKPQKHDDGTTIYHLSGYFSRFSPVMGSELFYHMADLTAQTYNDGGFSMIYLDAIDGIGHHTNNSNDTKYYYQTYTQRILQGCHDDPIIEFSASAPQMWNVRGRMGAWDTPTRGYKQFVKAHLDVNLKEARYNFTTNIGWFHFFPDSSATSGMRNTIEKTLFRDDIDYMGTLAVLYNMGNVLYSFNASSVDNNPQYQSNLEYYAYYNTIRKSEYFTAEAKQKVIDHGGEFKIIEKSKGEYAFLEMYYSKYNVGNVLNDTTFTGKNPFKTQEPFIRIEGRWSTLSENEVVISGFEEDKPLSNQTLGRVTSVKMDNNMVMKFKVKGTGNDGDAMLISLTGALTAGESGGRIDHFIDLNFTGWRDFVILDADNAEYDTDKYTFDGIGITGMQYSTYRTVPGYKHINKVTVRLCGATAGNAYITPIKGYLQTEAPVKNPTITVGNSSITFNATLQGSDFIEFDPVTRKAYLTKADQSVTEITYSGKLEIPTGSFNGTYTATAETDAPVRAKVVFGFSGIEITN
ncbi:MAG: S-layer homology domain-containing protein, partial [Clostridia bacterium]|nr:S-layer homology domain-containing protein [Clostridia bacterium]